MNEAASKGHMIPKDLQAPLSNNQDNLSTDGILFPDYVNRLQCTDQGDILIFPSAGHTQEVVLLKSRAKLYIKLEPSSAASVPGTSRIRVVETQLMARQGEQVVD